MKKKLNVETSYSSTAQKKRKPEKPNIYKSRKERTINIILVISYIINYVTNNQ